MARIFISHSSADDDQADQMKAWLAGAGFESAFLYKDKTTGVPPGADWERALYREVEQSQAVIIIQTPSWLASKWCFAEFTQARALGKAIFPVIVAPTGDTLISPDIQALNLLRDRDGGLERLKRELVRIALDAQGGFEWDAHRPPFPGMFAFEEADAAVYFGRDEDIRRLIERLDARRAQGGARLIVLLGSSGSGKSSLLRAGVIPRLKRARPNWIVVPTMRPRLRPVDELATALATARHPPVDWAKIRDDLIGSDPVRALDDFSRSLRGEARANEARILIPIDQAEELFGVADPAEARRFLTILSQALSESLPFMAVMTMRADFLGHLQSAPSLTARYEEFSLGPMPLIRIPQIIEGPARRAALRVEDEFVQQAAHDAETEDALPLLAFTLRELFDRSKQGSLSLQAYRALGDEATGLTPLENAVRKAADTVLSEANATDEELTALREAIVPAMVRVNEQGEYARRPARFDALPAKSRPLLERLADARLLTLRQEGDARVVEVAHEALLRKWPWLKERLDAERVFLIGKQQLEQDLRDWQAATDKDKADALMTGLKLTRARAWLIEHPTRLTVPERSFIEASIDREDGKERLRRIVTWGAGLVAVVLAVAVVAAWQESSQATKAGKVATMQNWATQARTEAGTPRGLLLGLNSISLSRQLGVSGATQFRQLLIDLLSSTGGLPLHHPGPVVAVQFSPDDRWLASASGNDVLLWDTRVPAAEPRVLAATHTVEKVVFSPDGRMLAAIGNDAAVRLYDMRPASPATSARTLAGHTKPLKDLAFSPDGHWLATASEDGTVRLWDMSVPDQFVAKRILSQPNQVVWTLAFSPDGRWLATGGEPGGVRLWDLRDPLAEPKILRDSYGHNRKVAFSPDSNWLVAGATESYQALLFHAPFDGPPLSFHVGQWIERITFSPDKRWLVVPDHDDAMVMDLNKADPRSDPIFLRGHKDAVTDMGFSPDGTWLATGSAADHIVRLWNAADHFSGPRVFAGHEGPISALAFSHDNRWLATASEDKTVRRWDVGSPLAEPLSLRSASDPTKLRIWNLRTRARLEVPRAWGDDLGDGAGTAFSPDGKWLAAFSDPHHPVTLWKLTTSPPMEFRLDHPGFASPVFSPDGRWLATGGLDGKVKLWDLTSSDPGARSTVLAGHFGFIRSLAFSANSHWLVSGAQETIARVWDLTTSDPAAKPKALLGGGGTSIVRTVAISPNGRYVLTGSWEPDYAARIWDMSLPDPASNPIKLGFNGRVFGSAFSADGRWAAAIDWDHSTQLFNLTKPGAKPFVLPGAARVLSLAFSPDNQWLAAGAEDRSVRLWSLTADDPSFEPIKLTASAGADVSFSPDGRLLAVSASEHRINPFSPDGSLFASIAADAEIYDIRVDDLVARACQVAGRDLTADEVGSSAAPLDAAVCPPAAPTPSPNAPASNPR